MPNGFHFLDLLPIIIILALIVAVVVLLVVYRTRKR
jgi:hypothetical protein